MSAQVDLTSPTAWAAFLRAGGTVPWQEWVELGPEQRAAMEAAGALVAEERAAAVADAILSRLDRAGEEAAIERGLDRALDLACSKTG